MEPMVLLVNVAADLACGSQCRSEGLTTGLGIHYGTVAGEGEECREGSIDLNNDYMNAINAALSPKGLTFRLTPPPHP